MHAGESSECNPRVALASVLIGWSLSFGGTASGEQISFAVPAALAATTAAPAPADSFASPQQTAKLLYEAKKADTEGLILQNAAVIKAYGEAKVRAVAELTTAEGQARKVERELASKSLDETRRAVLRQELSSYIMPALKKQQQELQTVLTNQRRAEKTAVDLKARLQSDAKSLRAALDRLNADDARRATSVVKAKLASVKAAQARVKASQDKLKAAQEVIKKDISNDGVRLQEIRSLEGKLANMKAAEQALVQHILEDSAAADNVIQALKAADSDRQAAEATFKAAQKAEAKALALAPKKK